MILLGAKKQVLRAARGRKRRFGGTLGSALVDYPPIAAFADQYWRLCMTFDRLFER